MSTKEKLYYLLIAVLCVVSVVFAVLDYNRGLTRPEQIADWIIYAFFVIDYVVRFILADSKRAFFIENIFDLIAIIPVNSAMRVFRLARFVKLLRLVKLFRIGALSARLGKRSEKFFDTNGFKYVLMICAIAILLSAVAMTYFENMSFPDALWWSFVTATTVGYGDLSPASGAGRIIACMLMIVGIGLIGSLTSTITAFFLRDNNKEPNSERVDMVVQMYDLLNDEEKEQFKETIK